MSSNLAVAVASSLPMAAVLAVEYVDGGGGANAPPAPADSRTPGYDPNNSHVGGARMSLPKRSCDFFVGKR